jgi:cobalt/nickel transport system permease protein
MLLSRLPLPSPKLPQAYLQTSFFLKEKLSAASIPHTKSTYTRSLASLLAVSSAFVFVAQMLNFPIVYGTSGNLVGGTFHAMVLGHYAAILSMTIVLLM